MISRPSAWSARARWATASRRCSRRPGSRCGSSTSRSRCSIARAATIEKSLGEVRREGQAHRGRSRRGARPPVDRDRRSTTSPTPTTSSKRSSRTPTPSARSSASLDAITQAGRRSSPRTPRRSRSPLLGAATKRPDKVLGMHFMNPVPLMTLVELIRGQATSDESMRIASELCAALGKTGVEAADYPGFIANRILMPMINEAIFAVMEGVGTPEAIDAVMKLGMNHPMGPLTLADFIGLDVCLAILNVLHDGLRRSEVPAVSAAPADGRGRPSRAQVGPGLLRVLARARRRPAPRIAISCSDGAHVGHHRPAREDAQPRRSAGRCPSPRCTTRG